MGTPPMDDQTRLLNTFRAGLSMRRARLIAAWGSIDLEAGLQEAYQVTHKLAGAAGAYRLVELQQAALNLERGLHVWLRTDPSARPPAEGLKRLLGPVYRGLLECLENTATKRD